MLAMFVAACVLFFAQRALAAEVQIDASASTSVVEVGSTITYSMRAMVKDGDPPSDPKPGNVAGFTVTGTSASPMRMHMNVNGVASVMNGIVAVWKLRADKVGAFTLGPPSVSVNRARQSGNAVRVTVVPKGQGPRASGVDPFDPFGGQDPFGGLSPFGGHDPFGGALAPFRGFFGDDEPEPAPRATADPKLNLDAPRAPVAFLHATVDKTKAVLGEQVTMNVYLYMDPMARQGQPTDVHEATATDFVKRSLLEDESHTTDLGTAIVGGRLWGVVLVRKSALFPLKTGRLTIAPMSLTLSQLRSGQRESESLVVDVTEPPLDGRPAGFISGNVGNFSLQATVSDRSIEQDGAVGVTIELRGTGNLPSELNLPVTRQIEWLEGSTRDKLGAEQKDRFGGTRTFSYVVRIHQAGAVELGEIRLPFYDPDKRAYGVATAALGIVDVKPGTSRDAGADETVAPLSNMPKERTALEEPVRDRRLTDSAPFWFLLFGAPLACVVGLGAERAVRNVRKRRSEASPTPAQQAKQRREEASTLVDGNDAKAAMGGILRAIRAGVLAETGVHLGATGGEKARGELTAASVSDETSHAIVTLLREAEDAQFSPEGLSMAQAKETWARAEKVLTSLERRR